MGGKGSGRQRTRYVEVKSEAAEPENESLDRAPLFAALDDSARDELDSILVMRVAPVREGAVGQIEPGDGLEEIGKRWGGGKYKVQGRNADGKPIKGAWDTVEVAGEPKFKSRAADLEYKRQLGEIGGVAAAVASPAGSSSSTTTPSAFDIVSILVKQSDIARGEAAQREQERDAQHRRDMERIREESRLREEARARDEERRDKERREDERRERERHEEIERRRTADQAEARRRDQEWYSNMLKQHGGAGGGGDAVSQLMAGVKLALDLRDDRGGGEGGGIGEVVGKVIAAIAANAGKSQPAPAGALPPDLAARAAAPKGKSSPAAAGDGRSTDDDVVLAGSLGRSAKAAIVHLQSIGVDPRQALGGLFDQLMRAQRPPETAPAAPATNGVTAHQEAPPAAANVTTEANSGTP